MEHAQVKIIDIPKHAPIMIGPYSGRYLGNGQIAIRATAGDFVLETIVPDGEQMPYRIRMRVEDNPLYGDKRPTRRSVALIGSEVEESALQT
jgi:hypothetical protein